MSVWENVKMALDSIFAHKLRSFLTMLGIVIGVASVIIIVSIGQGGEAQLTEAFAGTGNTITVMPGPEMQLNEGGALPDDLFTEEDIRALERLPEVKRVFAVSYSTADIRYRGERMEGAVVFGINNNGILEMDQRKLSEGSGFRTSDFLSGSAGALVSADIRDELFERKKSGGKHHPDRRSAGGGEGRAGAGGGALFRLSADGNLSAVPDLAEGVRPGKDQPADPSGGKPLNKSRPPEKRRSISSTGGITRTTAIRCSIWSRSPRGFPASPGS